MRYEVRVIGSAGQGSILAAVDGGAVAICMGGWVITALGGIC